MDSSDQVDFCLDLKAVQTNLVLFLQELLMKFCKNCLAVAVCLYFWGLTVPQPEFSLNVVHVFICLIFFCSVYQKRCVLFTTNLAAGLISEVDLEFFL